MTMHDHLLNDTVLTEIVADPLFKPLEGQKIVVLSYKEVSALSLITVVRYNMLRCRNQESQTPAVSDLFSKIRL